MSAVIKVRAWSNGVWRINISVGDIRRQACIKGVVTFIRDARLDELCLNAAQYNACAACVFAESSVETPTICSL